VRGVECGSGGGDVGVPGGRGGERVVGGGAVGRGVVLQGQGVWGGLGLSGGGVGVGGLCVRWGETVSFLILFPPHHLPTCHLTSAGALAASARLCSSLSTSPPPHI